MIPVSTDRHPCVLNTRTCTSQRLLLADHAQPVGMRLSAYFGKRLHGVLLWTHVHMCKHGHLYRSASQQLSVFRPRPPSPTSRSRPPSTTCVTAHVVLITVLMNPPSYARWKEYTAVDEADLCMAIVMTVDLPNAPRTAAPMNTSSRNSVH